jgi:hypothetical protein
MFTGESYMKSAKIKQYQDCNQTSRPSGETPASYSGSLGFKCQTRTDSGFS